MKDSKQRVNDLDEFKAKLTEILNMAENVNFEYHGRPDCKNCSLLETIRDELLKEQK